METAHHLVAAGLNLPEQTVGLSGLAPFAIRTPAPVRLRLGPGCLRVWIDLPAGVRLDLPVLLRVHGGEAGLDFDRNGQIVNRGDTSLPIELPYTPRAYPAPPAAGQLALDISFFHVDVSAGERELQDVQWRQTIVWDAAGADVIELRYALGE